MNKKVLSPAFYPEPDGHYWEAEGRRAPTIRQLLEMFPGREVEDYYPNGYKATRTNKPPEVKITRPTRTYVPVPPKVISKYDNNSACAELRVKILEIARTTELSASDIAKRFGVSKGVVSGLCYRANIKLGKKDKPCQ